MSDKSIYEIIKQIAQNTIENSNLTDIRLGVVESVNPLKVRLTQKLILTENFLELTKNVKDYETKIVINGRTETIKVLNGLKKGERVLMIKYQNGQKYLILERAD